MAPPALIFSRDDVNPKHDPAASLKAPVSALDYELAQEMAGALGRAGRALEVALRKLADFNGGHDASARQALVQEAGAALWNLTVQREACGLRDTARLMKDYAVPPEVRAAAGVVETPLPRRGWRPRT